MMTANFVVTNGISSNMQIGTTLLAEQPGVFTQDGTEGSILHLDYSPVTAANPAMTGETVQIFTTGLGAVINQPATGAAAPGGPNLAKTLVQPAVSMGGVTANVSFSGLAPGFVGLFQLNVAIPAGVPSGNADLIVAMNGISSKLAKIPTK